MAALGWIEPKHVGFGLLSILKVRHENLCFQLSLNQTLVIAGLK